MKSLVPWVCLLAATTSQNVLADDFSAYRLGNYNKAIEPLLSQSDKNSVADYYLGRIYLYGYGQLKNTQLAMRYFTQAAQKGYLPATQLLAKYALLHDKDPQQAVGWFKRAAAAGDVNAQMFMAAAYLYGIGVKKNQDSATHYYIDAAKNGNAIAQYTLAENFIDSRHATNNKLGLIWLNKAANNGNPQALTKLGALYLSGKMVDKDADKGMSLLNQAAAQGFAPAMVELGKASLEQNQKEQALKWFEKAGNYQNNVSYLELANVYLDEKSPVHDPKVAYLWTLKAAENGSTQAKRQLAQFYTKGVGVEADLNLAKQWQDKANLDDKDKGFNKALADAALWLSNGTTDKIEQTAYQMNGIFSAWSNPAVLGDNSYNQAPKLKTIARHFIFKPAFSLVQPNEVPITSYYDALTNKSEGTADNQWTYPVYRLNPQVADVVRVSSPVVAHLDLPAPYLDAYYPEVNPEVSVMDPWLDGWQRHVNFMSVFYSLYNRAILGDAQSQFEIGQMFQYGIGVAQNDESAIVFYQNAAQQQHLGAEYNLGLLYLQHAKSKEDYVQAINDLTDAAFKGNKKSQYVLSRILTKGITGPEGVEYIKADPEQATAMLYLAASNNYGPAEYDLANRLAGEFNGGISIEAKQHKVNLVRQLYQGAVNHGIANAFLPLAFYNAMDKNPKSQAQAFAVAKDEAAGGNDKAALLLGLLYDRGIGVNADSKEAMHWYQQSGENAISQFILGTYTAEGQGVEKNQDKGMALLQQSVNDKFSYADFNMAVLQQQAGQEFLPNLTQAYELGNSHAGIVLADYYLADNKNEDNMKQARQIYEGLAQKGDRDAQLKLAYMDEKGLGSAPDMTSAQRWYTASAEQGNAVAEYFLGQFYQVGANGEPDYNLAKQWYQKAAAKLSEASVALGFIYETVDDDYPQALTAYEQASAKGNPIGTYNLALMYLYGKGTPVNFGKAKELFIQAADKHINEAMNQLGGIYFKGLGTARDEQQALSWYKKAADLGNANALYELGLLSETGVTTKLDFNEALKYYQAAADKNNEKAMLALARMYRYGLGVTKNPKMAAELYQKLALRQNAYAQYQLATYYLDGTAGELSPAKGKQLLQQASDNGSPQARKALQRMEAQAQAKVSFIEPIVLNKAPFIAGEAANMMFFEALNVWDHGDELLSRTMLQYLVTQYPDFAPAKHMFEQVNQTKAGNFYS
jgi:enhanced entry protein EnhC